LSNPVLSTTSRVLVVDDQEFIRLLVQHTLEDAGYDVVLATNEIEALARFSIPGLGPIGP